MPHHNPDFLGTKSAGKIRETLQESWMSETGRTCPLCGSRNYTFRGRKKIAEDGKPEEWETRYLCRQCNKVWKDRMPVQPKKDAG
jgi:transposase-like protein